MNKLLLSATLVLFSASAALAAPHTYQVSGPVLELSDKSIVVSKGKENWEIMRDSSSKIPSDVKVGSKVTIEYTMTAVDVTDKSPKPAASSKATSTSTKAGKEDAKAVKVDAKAATTATPTAEKKK